MLLATYNIQHGVVITMDDFAICQEFFKKTSQVTRIFSEKFENKKELISNAILCVQGRNQNKGKFHNGANEPLAWVRLIGRGWLCA